MSNSFCSCGLKCTRILCLWDSPGKNTRVGCHFLFQGIFLIQGLNVHLLSPTLVDGLFIITSLSLSLSLPLYVPEVMIIILMCSKLRKQENDKKKKKNLSEKWKVGLKKEKRSWEIWQLKICPLHEELCSHAGHYPNSKRTHWRISGKNDWWNSIQNW